jgi:hypothetical protein
MKGATGAEAAGASDTASTTTAGMSSAPAELVSGARFVATEFRFVRSDQQYECVSLCLLGVTPEIAAT